MRQKMKIRKYNERDLCQVALLISETFRKYNYSSHEQAASDEYVKFYDPSRGTEEIRKRFDLADEFLVAEVDEQIVGMLRANKNRILNLFVGSDYHKQRIGKQLIQRFEDKCRITNYAEIVLRSQLYAVPFYSSCGYKKTTGIRKKFGLVVQPMKKILTNNR